MLKHRVREAAWAILETCHRLLNPAISGAGLPPPLGDTAAAVEEATDENQDT